MMRRKAYEKLLSDREGMRDNLEGLRSQLQTSALDSVVLQVMKDNLNVLKETQAHGGLSPEALHETLDDIHDVH